MGEFERMEVLPPPFFYETNENVGPCCWLDKKGWEEEQKRPDLPTERPKNDYFQGAIYLLEYNLTIGNTPAGNIDVFSYGESSLCPHPILHAVFDGPTLLGQTPMETIKDRGVVCTLDMKGCLPRGLRDMLPHPLSNYCLAVRLVIIDNVPCKTKPYKGTAPTVQMAANSRYIQPTQDENSDVDAFLLLGRYADCEEHQLLLLRFFSTESVVGQSFQEYESLLNTTNVWEAWRAGGSNGPPRKSHSLWKFLSTPRTAPRLGMGIVILPFTDHWLYLYLSPYAEERKLCRVKYKQPHQGGQIIKKKQMLKDHPKIKGFAMSKLVCAFVLDKLFEERQILVARDAVLNELSFGARSLEVGNNEAAVEYYVQHHCNYTLVTHAVGFHVDTSKNGTTSFLENRVVLTAERNRKEPNIPEGRSLHSPSKFEYALLDWP